MSAYHIQPGEDENWCQSSLIYWYWCTDSLLYRPFIFRLGVYIFNATHCIVVPIRSKAFSSDSVDLNKAAGHLNIRLQLHQLAFASSSWSKLLACHLLVRVPNLYFGIQYSWGTWLVTFPNAGALRFSHWVDLAPVPLIWMAASFYFQQWSVIC